MAVKARGQKSRIDFKLGALISCERLCHFAIMNLHSNDKALILDLLNLLFPFEFILILGSANRTGVYQIFFRIA